MSHHQFSFVPRHMRAQMRALIESANHSNLEVFIKVFEKNVDSLESLWCGTAIARMIYRGPGFSYGGDDEEELRVSTPVAHPFRQFNITDDEELEFNTESGIDLYEGGVIDVDERKSNARAFEGGSALPPPPTRSRSEQTAPLLSSSPTDHSPSTSSPSFPCSFAELLQSPSHLLSLYVTAIRRQISDGFSQDEQKGSLNSNEGIVQTGLPAQSCSAVFVRKGKQTKGEESGEVKFPVEPENDKIVDKEADGEKKPENVPDNFKAPFSGVSRVKQSCLRNDGALSVPVSLKISKPPKKYDADVAKNRKRKPSDTENETKARKGDNGMDIKARKNGASSQENYRKLKNQGKRKSVDSVTFFGAAAAAAMGGSPKKKNAIHEDILKTIYAKFQFMPEPDNEDLFIYPSRGNHLGVTFPKAYCKGMRYNYLRFHESTRVVKFQCMSMKSGKVEIAAKCQAKLLVNVLTLETVHVGIHVCPFAYDIGQAKDEAWKEVRARLQEKNPDL